MSREYDAEIAALAGEAPPLSDAEREALKAEIMAKIKAAENAPRSAIEQKLEALIERAKQADPSS